MRQMKDTLKLAVLYTLHFSSSTSFRERRLQDSVFTNTYASFTFSTKFSHEFIKIMHSLDPFPFAQLSDITPQYLLRSHLLQHGLELLHPWQTVSVLDSNTPLVNCLFSFFSLSFCLSSLVKLCAERCFLTNSKPKGSALYMSMEVSCSSSEVAHFSLLFNHSAPSLI